ncbi:hypothetical protein TNCV_4135211 [Trichonephila clavipes]|nr:hypothetical protein TNCV_4135211 [Trichonephila clavipes]
MEDMLNSCTLFFSFGFPTVVFLGYDGQRRSSDSLAGHRSLSRSTNFGFGNISMGLSVELAHDDVSPGSFRTRAAQCLLLQEYRLLRSAHAQVHLLQQPEGLRLQQQF